MIVICNLHPQRVLNRWCRALHVSVMSVRTECQWVLKTQLSSTAVLWDEFNISCMRARKEWSLFVLFTSYVTGILGLSTEHTVSHQLEFNTFQIFCPNTHADAPSIRRERDGGFPSIQDTTGVFPSPGDPVIFSRVLSIINFKLAAFRQRVMQMMVGSQ